MWLAHIMALFVSLAAIVDAVSAAGLKLSSRRIQLQEGGGSHNYTVVLTSKPVSAVIVSVHQLLVASDQREDEQHWWWREQIHPQLHFRPPVLVFNPGNWNIPKSISVVALDDSVAERPAMRLVRVQHAVTSSDPQYNNEVSQADESEVLECTIEEDDEPGVLLSAGALSAKRGGDIVHYSMHLQSQPTAEVTIDVAHECRSLPQASAQVQISPKSLVFTKSNWKDPQVLKVQALDNGERNCNSLRCSAQTHVIHHTSSSSDPSFNHHSKAHRSGDKAHPGLFSHAHVHKAPSYLPHLRHAGEARVVLAVHDSAPKQSDGQPPRNLGSSHASVEEVSYSRAATHATSEATTNKSKKSTGAPELKTAPSVDRLLSEEL